MREEEAKKKMPMASAEDLEGESVGLRVGPQAWKWPPVYPYDDELFLRPDAEAPLPNPMAIVNGEDGEETEEAEKERVSKSIESAKKFWTDEPSTSPFLSESSVSNLRAHFNFYISPSDNVLEFGCGSDSYFPPSLNLSRHVGVAFSDKLMKENPSVTEFIMADLNEVEIERGVESEEIKALGQSSFDKIVMTNTIDFLTHPREVFRTAWYLLKPGGTMIVPFSSRDAYKGAFEQVQTKMWRTMNDDQHMWVCGSFFQFSAGDGWTGLKGFDISPPKPTNFVQEKLDKTTSMYVVQASKASLADTVDPSNPSEYFSSALWLAPVLESRDKMLISPRLSRAWQLAKTEEKRKHIEANADVLPTIYESLVKMDSFAFPFNLQAQLATNLMEDVDFDGNDSQISNLRMGLGLDPPNAEVWSKVGQLTAALEPEDKVSLLAHIVPRFGRNGPAGEQGIKDFVDGLQPTFEVIKKKCQGMNDKDVQLAGSELLAAEILIPGRSTKSQFAKFISALTASDIEGVLARRRSFKEVAEKDMAEMVKAREEEMERRKQEVERMQKQIEDARENRSMVFNEETGAFEEVEV